MQTQSTIVLVGEIVADLRRSPLLPHVVSAEERRVVFASWTVDDEPGGHTDR
jgi:hypothetical protein